MPNNKNTQKNALTILRKFAVNRHRQENSLASVKFAVDILDAIIGSSSVRHVPQTVMDIATVANRICRFVRKDVETRTVIGTGVLIGTHHVLTAAHLFFDKQSLRVNDAAAERIKVEFDSLVLGNGVVSAGVTEESLENTGWLLDPLVENGQAKRDVKELDYAVVVLRNGVANHVVGPGTQTRGYFRIPSPRHLAPLAENKMMQVFQYNDLDAMRSSIGRVEGISRNPLRVRYSASTLDASSGSPVFDDEYGLIALHVSGPSETFPRQNQGLPLRAISSSMEKQGIRTTLQWPEGTARNGTNVEISETPKPHWHRGGDSVGQSDRVALSD